MNKEEAIEILLMLSSLNNSETHPKCNEALTLAIQSLEAHDGINKLIEDMEQDGYTWYADRLKLLTNK